MTLKFEDGGLENVAATSWTNASYCMLPVARYICAGVASWRWMDSKAAPRRRGVASLPP